MLGMSSNIPVCLTCSCVHCRQVSTAEDAHIEMMALQREVSISRQKSAAERSMLEAQHAQAMADMAVRHQAELRQHAELAAQGAAVNQAQAAQLQQVCSPSTATIWPVIISAASCCQPCTQQVV